MIAKKISIRALLICLFLLLASSTLSSSIASAQQTQDDQCNQNTINYYDGRTDTRTGSYDIYVKLGKRGQSSKVSLEIEGETSCKKIGSTTASGEKWTKIGSWNNTKDNSYRFILSSEIFYNMPDANRPRVLIVPKQNPPCIPEKQCFVKISGQSGFIEPKYTSLAENDLVIAQVTDPKDDKIEKVEYYVGSKYQYTTTGIEDFNLRLVPAGNQTLSRVIIYKSGQKVVIEDKVYVSFTKDFGNLIYRTFNSNRVWIQVVVVLFFATLLIFITLMIIRIINRKRQWKINHGIVQPTPVSTDNNSIASPDDIIPTNDIPSQPATITKAKDNLVRVVKVAMPVFAIASISLFIIIVDYYIVEIFRVDGISMENTLKDDDKLLVNKSSRTWANINSQKYIPKRGEVIIFQKPSPSLVDDNEKEGPEYVVKRVLGLPGERITVNKGIVLVYNQENPKGFNPDKSSDWEDTYNIGDEDNIDITLAENEVFVSGDNRPESLDSRINGPIDIQYIVGRVDARISPLKDRMQL